MSSELRGATLVLGGSGFLGAHVTAVAGKGAVSASRAPGPRSPGRFVKLDATVPGDLERVLAALAPARIVDCAALSSVAEAKVHPELVRALNVEVPRTLALWCAKTGARFVHVSTDLVFGASDPGPGGFREEDPPAPVSEYGRSKAAGEEAVLEACASALVVRLPLLYGDSFGQGRGASDSLLAAIRRGERPLFFTDEWRTPLEVSNAARALVELASLDRNGLLHVAGPDRMTRYELALAVLESRGMLAEEARARIRAGTRAEAGLEETRPRDTSLDASRARGLISTRLLGLREGLARGE
jgi:dTDP-4-dehydrorhamnose reductase